MSDCSNAINSKDHPKAMCCRGGEFHCERPVLYTLGRNRLIYVDRCMIPEIHSLWNRGIETCGCCCGHFEKDGFIQVLPEYVGAMRELGYEEIPPVDVNGELMGKYAFKPKTQLEFNGYLDIKTELEQRYQQLEHVAVNLFCKAWALIINSLDGNYEVRRKIAEEELSAYHEQLSMLGVSFDD